MNLKPTLLIALDNNDGLNYIKKKNFKQVKISIITKPIQLASLSKGHKILNTNMAYINSNINEIISELTMRGYSIRLWKN